MGKGLEPALEVVQTALTGETALQAFSRQRALPALMQGPEYVFVAPNLKVLTRMVSARQVVAGKEALGIEVD